MNSYLICNNCGERSYDLEPVLWETIGQVELYCLQCVKETRGNNNVSKATI